MGQGRDYGRNVNIIVTIIFGVVLLALLVLIILTAVMVSRFTPPTAQLPPTPAGNTAAPTSIPAAPAAVAAQATATSQPSGPAEDYSTIESTIQTLQQRGNFDIGVGKESAPYAFEKTTGAHDFDGYEFRLFSEIVRRWQGKITFTVDYKPYDIPFRFPAVISNEVDLVISAIPESLPNCTGKTMCSKYSFARDEQKIMLRDDANVPDPIDPDSLCNFFKSPQMVGFIQGTAAQREMDNYFAKCKLSPTQLKPFENRRAAIGGVLDGSVGGYITFGHVLDYYRQNNPRLKVVSFQPHNDQPAYPQSIVAVFRSNSQGLRDLVDITLAAMVYDGTYEKIIIETASAGLSIDAPAIVPTPADCNSVIRYWDIVRDPKGNQPQPKCS